MHKKDIWPAIELELRKAKKEHPNWPDHVVAQAALVVEPAGNLTALSLLKKYGPKPAQQDALKNDLQSQAIRTAAMAILFLENMREA